MADLDLMPAQERLDMARVHLDNMADACTDYLSEFAALPGIAPQMVMALGAVLLCHVEVAVKLTEASAEAVGIEVDLRDWSAPARRFEATLELLTRGVAGHG